MTAPQQAALATIADAPLGIARVVHYAAPRVLLVTGPAEAVTPLLAKLPVGLDVLAVVTGRVSSARYAPNVRLMEGRVARVEGWMGAFSVSVASRTGDADLASFSPGEGFDLILDLNEPSLIAREVLPRGYAAAPSGSGVANALRLLAEAMQNPVKPVFFSYQADLCSHGARSLTGCTRCLSICPADAITSMPDTIRVEPFLCHGCGSCTAVCPSGALSYARPSREALLGSVDAALTAYRDAGGQAADLVFHSGWPDADMTRRLAEAAPSAIPVALASVGAVGIEVVLAALAAGFRTVVLIPGASAPASLLSAIDDQRTLTEAVLDVVDGDHSRFSVLGRTTAGEAVTALRAFLALPRPSPGLSSPIAIASDKRRVFLDALGALAGDAVLEPIALPAGAPFGTIEVDPVACTLCGACATLCPPAALAQTDDQGLRLDFIEERCVQCGLCVTGCPEQAVTLIPRLRFDAERKAPQTLNRGDMFACIECGTPFISRKVLERTLATLKDHPQVAASLDALNHCPACRQRATTSSPPALPPRSA